MPTQSKFKKSIFALLIAGFLVRLIFVFAVEQIPVMWDARIYSSAALGLLHYIKNPDRFGHPEKDSSADSVFYRAQFEHTMKENIEGEQIEWLYYDIPTATEAHDYLFLSGPVYPFYLAALFFISPGGDFMLIRLLNVLLDVLCLLFLVLIARELFGDRTGLLAGLIYLFYRPFILLTGMVSPEPMTVSLTLLTMYMILLWHKKGPAKYMIYSGIILGLLAMLKPTAVLLFAVFGAGFLYDCRRRLKKTASPLVKAAVPFLIMILPWLIVTSSYFGKLSIRDPDYSAANIRSSSSIEYEGYDLDYTDEDFWTAPVMKTIRENPLGYAGLLAKKFNRLWQQPYNDYRQSFIFNPGTAVVYHFLIIIAGLFGIFIFWGDSRKGLIYLFLLPLYYAVIHVVFHALARYNLNAMPFMIIAAAAVYIKIDAYIKRRLADESMAPNLIKWIMFIAGGLFVFLFPVRWGATAIGQVGIIVMIIVKTAVLLLMLYYLFREITAVAGRGRSLKLTAVPALVILFTVVLSAVASDHWAEWQCRLERPGQAAGTKIFIPSNIRLQPGEVVRIGIGMTGNKNRTEPFYLIMNGKRSSFYFDRPPLSDFYYKKMTYNVFQTLLDIGPEAMPAWRFVPLNSEVFNQLLDQYGFIDIAIERGPAGYVDLRGGYNFDNGGTVRMPSLTHSSIERFTEKGDPRIWVDYNLSSDSAISYYIEDIGSGRYDVEDLSPAFGRQNGRYRIILEIKRLDESRYYF